ncbi:Phasin protein [Bradyrhizobium sp. Ghvi]|uniref:phasin family protein n=1 Tax=Bradyrhizobium sp. Ghvi TaxID=1855319 RepID=UPI0008E4F56F|nr:phasin family protein [Bradyrhizobium sp. Ghvi]SFO81362.1 Phasin protein [Bradyrhizobium sp. Ghvi]
MLSSIENKPAGKSGRRGGKKKAAQRTGADKQHATAAHQSADAAAEISQGNKQEQDNRQEVETTPRISAAVASAAALPPGTEVAASAPVAPVESLQASPQAIADAYSRYISNSLEDAWAFLGKLATARSPIEAFELQIEYAKQACESFVAESREIVGLHEQMTRQRFMHFEGFVAKLTQTTLEIRATHH